MDMVGGRPTPLKDMSLSLGRMTFPIYENTKNGPKHQPVLLMTSSITGGAVGMTKRTHIMSNYD